MSFFILLWACILLLHESTSFDHCVGIKELSICNLIPLVHHTNNLYKGTSHEYGCIITVRLMIKYWSPLITVSGFSLLAKLSSRNKRRVKTGDSYKAKISFLFFLFLSQMQPRTNNWFLTEEYFIHFRDMEVPIYSMTCLSPQILLQSDTENPHP